MIHDKLCATCNKLVESDLIPCEPNREFAARKSRSQFFYFADPSSSRGDSAQASVQEVLRHYGGLETEAHGDQRDILTYRVDQIFAFARKECHLCTMITELMEIRDGEDENEALVIRPSTGRLVIPMLKMPSGWRIGQSFTAQRRKPEALAVQFHVLSSLPTEEMDGTWERQSLTLTPVPRAVSVPFNTMSSDCLRPDIIQRISSWLVACRTGQHMECSAMHARVHFDTAQMPRRLLKIAKIGSCLIVRLIDRNTIVGIKTDYVSLSHCWGAGEIICRLRQNNLHQYSTNIPFQSLPRTFRDAVSVTNTLGLYHLWIDALCIIQDSTKDWNEEAPRMATIYSNSAFTLAANASTNPDGGLFAQNNWLTPPILPCKWTDAGIAVQFSYTKDEYHLRTSPLRKRCWVFQEQRLTRRMIYFSSDQIHWGCPNGHHVENKQAPIETSLEVGLGTDPVWPELVRDYTSKSLTFGHDRLIALAGVAQAYARYRNLRDDDYLAGLWRDNDNGGEDSNEGSNKSTPSLVSQLLWFHGSSYDFDLACERAPTTYIAPSWSWAAINDRIDYVPTNEGTWNFHLRIGSAGIKTSGSSHFGPVTAGQLLISGLLHRFIYRDCRNDSAQLMTTNDNISSSRGEPTHMLSITGFDLLGGASHYYSVMGKNHFLAQLDPSREYMTVGGTARTLSMSFEAAFLPMFRRSSVRTGTDTISGLMLRGVDWQRREQKVVYKRVGLLRISGRMDDRTFASIFEGLWSGSELIETSDGQTMSQLSGEVNEFVVV